MKAGAVVSFSPLPEPGSYEYWRDKLALANNPKFIPIEHIDRGLRSREMQFWATSEAALVTRVKIWPGGAVSIIAVAAAADDGKDDITNQLGDDAMAWAKIHVGCDYAMVPGRVGWKRERPDFFHYQTILVKEL